MSTNTQYKYKDILETFNEGFPLLEKVYDIYEKSPSISKDQENTLRRSVEMTTLEILELIVIASRQGYEGKKETLRHAGTKVDTLKVFIDLAGQTGLIKDKEAQDLQDAVTNVGKMIGGWLKKMSEKKEESK